jgi:MFS family permease
VLATILATQAVLSLRLVWSNTASLREATYLSAGHVEIAHWLHGTPVPPYATFLPGAPVIYPPVAAIADSLGGLPAARILSLVFVLGATLLLWGTASRLFGWRAAVCAAALFAVLGPTLQLGALATPDAMALFLLAASVWCVVSAQDRDDSAPRLLAGVAFLAVASATLYSTMIFIPAVVALAGLTVAGKRGAKPAIARAGYVAAGALGLISALLAAGGPWYLAGVLQTTVSPTSNGNAALLALTDAWEWAGLVWVIAGAAAVLCALRRKNRVQTAVLAVLATSGVLPVLIQASTRTTTSFAGYVGFGAWFAAAAAGYAITQLPALGRRKSLHLAAAGLALAGVVLPAGLMGRAQAAEVFRDWPNSARMVAQLRSFTQAHPGHYLAEGYSVPAYYLESTTSWDLWSGTWYFRYQRPGTARPLTGMAAYDAAIRDHYFSLIMLNFRDTLRTDFYITADLHKARYERIGTAGRYTIWAVPPSGPPVSDRDSG